MDRRCRESGSATPLTGSVSVIVPVKPGGEVRALTGLKRAGYPAELFEVLVAYGSAPSAQRNRAAKLANGEILYFLDDDSQVAPAFLQTALGHYRDPKVAAVGGPSLTPVSDTPWQKSFGAAFASGFGGGGVRNRYRRFGKARCTDDSELILCNLSFRRDVFLEQGGLDERLYPNEENELMDRLLELDYCLVHDPELAVFRSQRPSYRAFVRQMFGYGRGRGEQTILSGGMKAASLAPSFFLIYLVLLAFFPGRIFAVPLFVYLVCVLGASLKAAKAAGRFALFPRLLLIYPTLHLMYGAGVLRGIFMPRFRRKDRPEPQVEVVAVKEMGKPWQ